MGAIHQALLATKGAAAGGGDDFDYTNLLWRIRADDLVLSNDDPVGTFSDTSGNGRDWTEATNRPIYKSSIDGRPAVSFSGFLGQQLLGPNLSGLGLSEIDLYIIPKANADPTNGSSFNWGLCTFNNGGTGMAMLYPYQDSNIYQACFLPDGTGKPTGNPTPSLAAWRLLRTQAKTGTGNYKTDVDGTNVITSTQASLVFPAVTKLGPSEPGISGTFHLRECFALSAVAGSTQYGTISSYINSYYPDMSVA